MNIELVVLCLDIVVCVVKFDKLLGKNYDKKLFVKLCKLCKLIVDDEGLLLYVVFSDVILIDMVEIMLIFYGEMLVVNGVG